MVKRRTFTDVRKRREIRIKTNNAMRPSAGRFRLGAAHDQGHSPRSLTPYQ